MSLQEHYVRFQESHNSAQNVKNNPLSGAFKIQLKPIFQFTDYVRE